jgi:hypothetical protein
MEVCYWALIFMPLVILHHLLNVFVQLANKRGFTKKKKYIGCLGETKKLLNGSYVNQHQGPNEMHAHVVRIKIRI